MDIVAFLHKIVEFYEHSSFADKKFLNSHPIEFFVLCFEMFEKEKKSAL